MKTATAVLLQVFANLEPGLRISASSEEITLFFLNLRENDEFCDILQGFKIQRTLHSDLYCDEIATFLGVHHREGYLSLVDMDSYEVTEKFAQKDNKRSFTPEEYICIKDISKLLELDKISHYPPWHQRQMI